jgi:hypothetical protein
MSYRIPNTAFADDSCLEVVYRMYWLCYHIHTYKKTMVMLFYMITGGPSFICREKNMF